MIPAAECAIPQHAFFSVMSSVVALQKGKFQIEQQRSRTNNIKSSENITAVSRVLTWLRRRQRPRLAPNPTEPKQVHPPPSLALQES